MTHQIQNRKKKKRDRQYITIVKAGDNDTKQEERKTNANRRNLPTNFHDQKSAIKVWKSVTLLKSETSKS